MEVTISFVTVCFNNLNGLKNTIDSLRFQFYNFQENGIELIVIDGGSDDGTKEYLNSLILPFRYTWISEPDEGIFDAMNKGLHLAVGRYINFLNSGDELYNNKVVSAIMLEVVSDDPIICGNVIVTEDGRETAIGDCGEWLPHQGVLIHRKLHLNYPYDTKLMIFGDLDLWLRLKKHDLFKANLIDLVIAKKESDGVGSHPSFLINRIADKKRLWKKHKNYIRLLSDCLLLYMEFFSFKFFGEKYLLVRKVLHLSKKAFNNPAAAIDKVLMLLYSFISFPLNILRFNRFGFGSFIHPLASTTNNFKSTIGMNVVINRNVCLWTSCLVIGDNVQINPNTCIYGNVTIGNYAMIGPNVMIAGGNHRFLTKNIPMMLQGSTSKGIKIEDDVWIGANAVICDGVTIGRGAIIAAGSVVTKNISEFTIAIGVPAVELKSR